MDKRIKYIAIIVAAMLLCSCAGVQESPQELPLTPQLPPKPQEGQPEERFEALLYFLSEAQTLVTENRTVERYQGESRAAAVLEAMLEGPDNSALSESLPEGLTLERVELTGTIANVVFSGMMPNGNDWLVARAAVAAAVCGVEKNISAVNVYLEDEEPGFRGRPLGTMTPIAGALDAYLEGISLEYAASGENQPQESDGFETKEATLYFLDSSGQWLLGCRRILQYAKSAGTESIVWALVDELTRGAPEGTDFQPVAPAGLTLALRPEIEEVLEADEHSILREDGSFGECIVHLTFYRPDEPLDEAMLRAALTLTITGYVPEVRGVSVTFLDQGAQPEDGLYDTAVKREDCLKYLGHVVDLLYPETEGSVLVREACAVSQETVYNAELRLRALLSHTPAQGGMAYPLFEEEDLISVETAQGLAVVNWTRGFAAKLAQLIDSQWTGMALDRRERMFIFGVVNTIAEIPGLNRVWMMEAGESLGTVDRICLGRGLLSNPGLTVD